MSYSIYIEVSPEEKAKALQFLDLPETRQAIEPALEKAMMPGTDYPTDQGLAYTHHENYIGMRCGDLPTGFTVINWLGKHLGKKEMLVDGIEAIPINPDREHFAPKRFLFDTGGKVLSQMVRALDSCWKKSQEKAKNREHDSPSI